MKKECEVSHKDIKAAVDFINGVKKFLYIISVILVICIASYGIYKIFNFTITCLKTRGRKELLELVIHKAEECHDTLDLPSYQDLNNLDKKQQEIYNKNPDAYWSVVKSEHIHAAKKCLSELILNID